MNNAVHFRTLEWKFRDTSIKYPELIEMPKKKITSPGQFFELFRPVFLEQPCEIFLVAWLSSSNRVIGFEKITQGTLNTSVVDPRAVFKGAIVANAASIIVAHNHPSFNPEPSNEDITITKKLVECGKILEIPVFDHIIFAGDQFTSFVEKRLI